jgi:predicted nucleic acid-binding protein
MRKRVYIETTIPNFYYTLRTDAESIARMNWTREWWQHYAQEFQLVSSAAVMAELRAGTSEMAERRISLLKDLEIVKVTPKVEEVVAVYIDRLVMPRDPGGDAMHLALTSVHGIDILLTWNCQHLANPNKMEHIRVVNGELGLPMPLLTTPLNYLSGGESDA